VRNEALRKEAHLPQFNRYIGIDYSGAVTPESSCKGLRVYAAEGTGTPEQVQPRMLSQERLRCGERLRQSGEDGQLAF
jgi:hypothetical protein